MEESCVSVAPEEWNGIAPLATLFGWSCHHRAQSVGRFIHRPSTVVSILIPLSREFVFVAPLLEESRERERGGEGELYNAAARVRPGLK